LRSVLDISACDTAELMRDCRNVPVGEGVCDCTCHWDEVYSEKQCATIPLGSLTRLQAKRLAVQLTQLLEMGGAWTAKLDMLRLLHNRLTAVLKETIALE